MNLRVALLLTIAARLLAQEDPDGPRPLSNEELLLPAGWTEAVPQDSLIRKLAIIEIARAEEAVSATGFWHRLTPKIQLGASLGASEFLFPDPAGGYFFPRDSYRISFSIAPLEIFDGSAHALALLQRAEARTRYALLLGKQSQARLALARKRIALTQDLALAREQMDLSRLLLEYYELLFRQGKAEFHTLTRSRLEAVKARSGYLDLERRVRELGSLIP